MGTRPELFQLAPFSHVCTRRSDVDIELIVAERLRNSLSEFDLPPPVQTLVDVDQASPTATLAHQLTTLDACWTAAPPDCVVVQGTSPLAFAAALAASALQIPVIHVDPLNGAGSLTPSPFASISERATGWLAAMQCVPTRQSAQQLIFAGRPRHTVFITGCTAVETWQNWITQAQQPDARWREAHAWLLARPYVVCDLSDIRFTTTQAPAWHTMNRLAVCHPGLQFVVITRGDQSETVQSAPQAMNLQAISTSSLVEISGLKSESRMIVSCSQHWREEQSAFRIPVVFWDGMPPHAESSNLLERCADVLNQPPLSDVAGLTADGRAAQRIVDLLAARAWNEPMTVRRAA